jgi:ribose transport system permease protein
MAQTRQGQGPRATTKPVQWVRARLRNIAPFVTLIALVAFFAFASPSFVSAANFYNILTQISVTGIIAVGLTFVISALLVRGQIAYSVPPLISTLGSKALGPVPWIVIVLAITLLIGHVVLTYTRFGRYVYMVGGNREAAEYSGVNVKLIISAVMVISAVCSGVAGMLGVAYFGSAQQNEFDTYLLDSISAVVVGGTSLFGGQGGIGNTIIGLFVLGVLNNGLDHVNIDSFLKILIRGLILLAALVINVYAQRMKTSSGDSGA